MLAEAIPYLSNVAFTVNRWFHLVAGTILVGGVLFFEFVVPLATADLKEEQQLSVFGRVRWAFRRVVFASLLMLILSGSISLWRNWSLYAAAEKAVGSFILGPRAWMFGHIVLAFVGFVILIRVTATRRLRNHPVVWMRGAMVVLLITMFLASIVREVRMRIREFPSEKNHAQREPLN